MKQLTLLTVAILLLNLASIAQSGFGPQNLLTPDTFNIVADGAQSVYAADIDGDGDMDMLSASKWDF